MSNAKSACARLRRPIRDAEGRVVAAVGIAGPTQRLSEDVLARFAPLVVNTAHLISARLGYRSVAGFLNSTNNGWTHGEDHHSRGEHRIRLHGRHDHARGHARRPRLSLRMQRRRMRQLPLRTARRRGQRTCAKTRLAMNERDAQRNRYLGCQALPKGDCKIKVPLRDNYKSKSPAEADDGRSCSRPSTSRTTSANSASGCQSR